MGHQVNFFLTPGDTASVEDAWTRFGPMTVLHGRSPTAAPRVLPSSDFEEGGQRWLFFALVRSEDLGSVVTKHVPAQGHWTIDDLRSPVVELIRCFFDGRVLRRGRLYFVDGYYGAGGAWIEKPEAFRKWGRSLLAATKRRLTRRDSGYLGPEARGLEASGVSLQ